MNNSKDNKQIYIRHKFPPLSTSLLSPSGTCNNNNNNNENDCQSNNEDISKWLNEQLSQTLDNLILIETKLNNGMNDNDDDLDLDEEYYGHGNNTTSSTCSMSTNGFSNGIDHEQKQQQIQDPQYLLISFEYLSLAHEYVTIHENNNDKNVKDDITSTETTTALSSWPNLIQTQCKLTKILFHHLSPTDPKIINDKKSSYQTLYQNIHERYTKIYQHLYAKSILEIRKYIHDSNFASMNVNNINENKNNDKNSIDPPVDVQVAIKSLIQIQLWNELLTHHMNYNESSSSSLIIESIKNTIDLIIQQFMKPIVHRIKYHFIANNHSDNDEQHLTLLEEMKKRPEKLLSWICSYIQDLIHDSDMIAVWDWIQSLLMSDDLINGLVIVTGMDDDDGSRVLESTIADTISSCYIHESFINEINQLINFVLFKHDYYIKLKKHASSASNASSNATTTSGIKGQQVTAGNRMAICHAIESMLRYDAFTKQILSDCLQSQSLLLSLRECKVTTLIDDLITNEGGLYQWWLDCERINALHEIKNSFEVDLVKKENDDDDDDTNSFGLTFILPYAETFLTLLTAFRMKTSLISQFECRKMFTKKVEIPICVRFIEGMHEKASILRRELIGRGRGVINIEAFKANIEKWIDVITGTTIAANSLHDSSSSSSVEPSLQQNRTGDENLEMDRIGVSLSKLADAMVEELSSTVVENLLLERTKFASYLMQCPYTLSSDEIDRYHSFFSNQVSPELCEGYQLLFSLCEVCTQRAKYANDRQSSFRDFSVLCQIPYNIMNNVAVRIEEKFTEIALDYNNMIPELRCSGCKIFAFDTNTLACLFQSLDDVHNDNNPFSRLKEIIDLMSMDIVKFEAFRAAMTGLLCNPLAVLPQREVFDNSVIEQLENDGTLYNEAQSMILAQGFENLNIYDVINVMNRRVSSRLEEIGANV